GLDDTIVRAPSQLGLVGVCSSSTPQSFTVLVSFDQAFFYNPIAGNLLLDIRNYGGPGASSPFFLDGQNVAGDSISHIQAFNVSSTRAGDVNSFGFVTEFVVQPIPEPRTWSLLVLGFAALAFPL